MTSIRIERTAHEAFEHGSYPFNLLIRDFGRCDANDIPALSGRGLRLSKQRRGSARHHRALTSVAVREEDADVGVWICEVRPELVCQ